MKPCDCCTLLKYICVGDLCDFEAGMCGWQVNSPRLPAHWALGSGGDGDGLGPLVDHTTQSSYGKGSLLSILLPV